MSNHPQLMRQGLVLLYCLLNLLFFIYLEPHRAIGGELLTNADFEQGLEGWKLHGKVARLAWAEGVLTIEHDRKSTTVLSQCWPSNAIAQPLLLRAEGRSRGVVHGPRPWHEARIDLVGYDAAGEGIYKSKTRLFGLQGDLPWQRSKALFELPRAAQRICLEIMLNAAPGRFQVRGLSMTQGQLSAGYRAGWMILLAGWVALAVWILPSLYRHYRRTPLGRWLLLVAGGVAIGVLMPHELRQQLEQAIHWSLGLVGLSVTATAAPAIGDSTSLWPAQWDLSTYAHLLGFCLLSVMLVLDRSLGPVRVISGLLLFAVTTETLQFFLPLRTPGLSDLLVNLMGISLGFVLALPVVGLRRRSSG